MAALKIDTTDDGVVLDVKVIPNAKAEGLVGLLGETLKVKVAAPPEGGKANKAVCGLLAGALGVDARAVTVVAGHGSPRKRIAITGLDAAAIRAKLDF